MDKDNAINEIISVGKKLYDKNMLAAADGNISVKISEDRILMTPSGLPKGFLSPSDIAVVTLNGDIISGRPSSEMLMHLEVFKQCSNAVVVIHAHPPVAVAWTVAEPNLSELPNRAISEMILAMGSLPIVPFARPGTQDMGDNLIPYLPKHRSLILARHGALSWGESFQEALNGMERIEHAATMLYHAKMIGGITSLPDEEIEFLKNKRVQLGDKNL
ncbi:MAG: class II aldolase/adducin family protein [Bacteriovoracaceae bacterium]|nr:class II aldolase/adducin family protein [Bacteriovoracaceae bacterium]